MRIYTDPCKLLILRGQLIRNRMVPPSEENRQRAIHDLEGSELRISGLPSEECLTALKAELLPMGFTEEEILMLLDAIRQKLVAKSR